MFKAEINQTLLRGGEKVPVKEVERLLKIIRQALHERHHWTISIAFVNEETIRRLNRDYRDKNQVTDVLSFEHKENDLLGEIVICYSVAKKQAEEKQTSARDEVILLITHGVLHLFGHDHEVTKEAKVMEMLQDWIMEKYHKIKKT